MATPKRYKIRREACGVMDGKPCWVLYMYNVADHYYEYDHYVSWSAAMDAITRMETL